MYNKKNVYKQLIM